MSLSTGTRLGPYENYRASRSAALYDVSGDAKRFLVTKSPQNAPGGGKLQAVVDWFEELRRRRVPAKR
jgi:hypothetical protein